MAYSTLVNLCTGSPNSYKKENGTLHEILPWVSLPATDLRGVHIAQKELQVSEGPKLVSPTLPMSFQGKRSMKLGIMRLKVPMGNFLCWAGQNASGKRTSSGRYPAVTEQQLRSKAKDEGSNPYIL